MTAPLLSLSEVSVSFGGIHALRQVSFDVEEGEIRGLIGANGAGKTTAMSVVAGAQRPTSGFVEFASERGPWNVRRSVKRGICRCFQTPRVFWSHTVRENLMMVSRGRREAPSEVVAAVSEQLGLEDWLHAEAADLPYGVVRRLSIALALCTGPRLLLLDEPAVGLTTTEANELAKTVRGLRERGSTILLIEHNMHFLMQLADRVAVLDRGRMIFDGSPEAARRDRTVIESYLGGEISA